MLQAYSSNFTISSATPITFNNVKVKGNSVVLPSPGTIQLNNRGVYMVSCNTSSDVDTNSIQLYKNGVPQPEATAVGPNATFITLVHNPVQNTNCCCSSPTTLQIMNTSTSAVTYDTANVCVTKIC